jgi:outer membrane protein OmpA-like peptidoglycan-associated protein
MTILRYWIIILVLAHLIPSFIFSQDRKTGLGVGVSFGLAHPISDIQGGKYEPIARFFSRYYPTPILGIEAGIGLGNLEAEKDIDFFSSYIVPVDARLILHPLTVQDVYPYLFGGIGIMYFNPVDKQNKRLPNNSLGVYGYQASYAPLGGGLQYFFTENIAVELTGAYQFVMSDYLDDIKRGNNDAFWNIGINFFALVSEGDNDWDKDGLLNDEEKQLGTDPHKPDTDGDGLRDGEEVHTYRTNPLNPDTDGDGLKDGEEVFKYHTDPLNPDTDGDGLSDGDEVLKYHTDPLNKDTDGDGLKDGDEVLKYRTDPLNPDTDGDGLSDGDEVLKYHTDPLNKDTDRDGLTDGDEVLKYHTDPLNPDTDHGGVPDGREIQLGLNPLDPSDDVPTIQVPNMQIGEHIILEGVNFENAQVRLLPAAQTILDQVAASLIADTMVIVAIEGHTDNVGRASYNMNLSLGRAKAVRTYLINKGVAAARMTTKGFGYTKPIADNATPDGKAKNRRIEFVRLR